MSGIVVITVSSGSSVSTGASGSLNAPYYPHTPSDYSYPFAPSGYLWFAGACGSMYMGPLPPVGVTTHPYGQGFLPPSYPSLSGATRDNPIPEFPGGWGYYVPCGSVYFSICDKCRAILQGRPYVQVNHTNCYRQYCYDCAGYTVQANGFETRESWIRETVPDYLQQAPSQIIADYLQDQSRYKDSEYMRNLKSMSGG